jgi:phage protein D
MKNERFIITIQGQEISDIYPNLIDLAVEMDDELAGMFRMRIALVLQTDGIWTHLDDKRLSLWNKVTISAGFFEDGQEEVMTGYITHLKPQFEPDSSQCILEIWGMDGSALMDREEKLKAWPNKKDSDIVTEILSNYGFTPKVDNTETVHEEAISTIIQRETDMQFLKRLALRNGFECFIDGMKGYFRKSPLATNPQSTLAVHFGKESNVERFTIEVNALTPSKISMFQTDRINKTVLDTTTDSSQQRALGKTDTKKLLNTEKHPGQLYLSRTMTVGQSEMEALCQGIFHQAEWFVTGEGEVAGNKYGHVLKPRSTVTIKGIGETYSGIYYVSHVTHTFSEAGYTQHFRVKRNGLHLTGREQFSGGITGTIGNVLGRLF